MRMLIIAVAVSATLGLGGAAAWQARAAAPAFPVPMAGPNAPFQPTACEGRNVDCPPGRHRVCGPQGRECWCAPC